MSDFHIKADIPADATDEQVDQIRADAFKTALTHAATDPKMRLDMIVGETASELRNAVTNLFVKLTSESPEIIALARSRVDAAEAEALIPPEIQMLSAALDEIDRREDLLARRSERRGR